jgi:hypothetical protein
MCRKSEEGGFYNRVGYTWVGVIFLSIGFYLFALATYQLIGRAGASSLSAFVNVTNHVFGTRSMSWLLIIFVPIAGMLFDVVGKVYSNMFYPTQTQIHLEAESQGKMLARQRRRAALRRRTTQDNTSERVSTSNV